MVLVKHWGNGILICVWVKCLSLCLSLWHRVASVYLALSQLLRVESLAEKEGVQTLIEQAVCLSGMGSAGIFPEKK